MLWVLQLVLCEREWDDLTASPWHFVCPLYSIRLWTPWSKLLFTAFCGAQHNKASRGLQQPWYLELFLPLVRSQEGTGSCIFQQSTSWIYWTHREESDQSRAGRRCVAEVAACCVFAPLCHFENKITAKIGQSGKSHVFLQRCLCCCSSRQKHVVVHRW